MKISRNQVERVIALYQNSTRPPVEKEDRREDKISLSKDGQMFQEIQRAIKESPDVRNQKISEIKKAITEGNYHVSGRDIAEKMVQRFLVDKLLSKD